MFVASARKDVPWLFRVVRELFAQCAAMREALETFLMAYDPSWPGACPQECFDTSDGHGYEMQDIAKDEARRVLQSDTGHDLLDRLYKLERVAEAAREALQWFQEFGYNRCGIAVQDDFPDHKPILRSLKTSLVALEEKVRE